MDSSALTALAMQLEHPLEIQYNFIELLRKAICFLSEVHGGNCTCAYLEAFMSNLKAFRFYLEECMAPYLRS